MLALRLPVELEARLDKLAKLTGRTKSFYAREAIEQHIADLEDDYLAEKRYAQLVAGKTTSVPLDEVEKLLGLDH